MLTYPFRTLGKTVAAKLPHGPDGRGMCDGPTAAAEAPLTRGSPGGPFQEAQTRIFLTDKHERGNDCHSGCGRGLWPG